MLFVFLIHISRMSQQWVSKPPYVLLFAIGHYLRQITLMGGAPRNPTQACAVCCNQPFVKHIVCVIHMPQIANPVIRFVLVYVVNLVLRERAVNVQPSQPMRPESNSVNGNSYVPFLRVTSNASGFDWAFSTPPNKHSSLWVVVKKFAQTLCGKIGLSHAVVLIKQWFGQKLSSVSALTGLRHFTASTDLSRRLAAEADEWSVQAVTLQDAWPK